MLLTACSVPQVPTGRTATPTAVTGATASPGPSPSLAASPSPSFAADPTPRSFARLPLDRGAHDGTRAVEARLELGPASTRGSYTDRHGGGTVADERGTWTSSPVQVPFVFDRLIASWNATTPRGTWIDVEMRASAGLQTTRWYTLATWSAGDETIHRTTVPVQDDADGRVNVDTFEAKAARPNTYELRVTLHRVAGIAATPSVRSLTAVTSGIGLQVAPPPFGGVARDLDVPTLSQETHTGHYAEYDGGGEAWCSPTSTAMVLGFWKTGPSAADLAAFPGATHADGQVDHAARYTYDWSYQGAGNWPYNTAYAAAYGLEAFVTRLRSLREAERFIEAGIPLVASVNGVLPGFLFTSTSGHLLVIRGFDANGDVIVNDPAVRANPQARKVYARPDFERVWLGGSTGTVYVIHPAGVVLPPNVPGVPPNW